MTGCGGTVDKGKNVNFEHQQLDPFKIASLLRRFHVLQNQRNISCQGQVVDGPRNSRDVDRNFLVKNCEFLRVRSQNAQAHGLTDGFNLYPDERTRKDGPKEERGK